MTDNEDLSMSVEIQGDLEKLLQPEGWWWLSFVDNERESGDRFLGASIVRANGAITATQMAYDKGCNPGGEVLVVQLPELDGMLVWANRLLTRSQCKEFDQWSTGGQT